MSKVDPRRAEVFAQELSKGVSQSEALRKALPAAKRWKPSTVHQEASRWAADPKVRARAAELQAAAAERVILKLEDLFEETKRLALLNPAGIIDLSDPKKPRVKLPHELDPATAAAVASFEIDDLGRIKYRFWDKNSSLERMAKILGAFERDNRQKNAVADLLEALSGQIAGPGRSLVPDGEEDDGEQA